MLNYLCLLPALLALLPASWASETSSKPFAWGYSKPAGGDV